MRRQTTPPTPDTAAQVRCALDLLRTVLCSGPDIDDLTAAAADWADDVAHSDATEAEIAQCRAIGWAADAMFRILAANDRGNRVITVLQPGEHSLFFEWPNDDPANASPAFAATVEHAVRNALGKGADA